MHSECSICFQAFDATPSPCRSCGSSVPACQSCLRRWSSASHSVRNCVVCRVAEGTVPSSLTLDQEGPLLSAAVFATVLFYSWIYVIFFARFT
jgi:hypothetical protein